MCHKCHVRSVLDEHFKCMNWEFGKLVFFLVSHLHLFSPHQNEANYQFFYLYVPRILKSSCTQFLWILVHTRCSTTFNSLTCNCINISLTPLKHCFPSANIENNERSCHKESIYIYIQNRNMYIYKNPTSDSLGKCCFNRLTCLKSRPNTKVKKSNTSPRECTYRR